MKTFVNLTPHEINIILPDGENISIPPSGNVARCSVNREVVEHIQDIPVNKTVFGEIVNLPEQQEGYLYIVSSLVAQACKGRIDVLIPDDTVRDRANKIIGRVSFQIS